MRWNGYADFAVNFSVGCSNRLACRDACWARRMAHRLAHMGPAGDAYRTQLERRGDAFWPAFHVDIMADWDLRLTKRQKPSRIALNFMGDICSEGVWDVYGMMQGDETMLTSHVQDEVRRFCARHLRHTFLILTKRPEALISPWPNNCWVGVSASTQGEARRRMERLQQVECGLRWVSLEPWDDTSSETVIFPEWVVIGGWSGAHDLRPEVVEAARAIGRTCKSLGIPVFVKSNMQILGGGGWPQEFPG